MPTKRTTARKATTKRTTKKVTAKKAVAKAAPKTPEEELAALKTEVAAIYKKHKPAMCTSVKTDVAKRLEAAGVELPKPTATVSITIRLEDLPRSALVADGYYGGKTLRADLKNALAKKVNDALKDGLAYSGTVVKASTQSSLVGRAEVFE